MTHSYSRRSPRWTVCLVAVQQVAAAQAVDILVEGFMVTWFGDQQEREVPCGQLLDEGPRAQWAGGMSGGGGQGSLGGSRRALIGT